MKNKSVKYDILLKGGRVIDPTNNIDDLHTLAKGLLNYETLTYDEVKDLLNGISPKRDDFDDDVTPTTTVTPSVPKTGGTTAPQPN